MHKIQIRHDCRPNAHPRTRTNPDKSSRSENATPSRSRTSRTLARDTQGTHSDEDGAPSVHVRERAPDDGKDACEDNGDRGVIARDGDGDLEGLCERDEGAIDDGLAEGT